MGKVRITLKDPSRFQDPFGLTWTIYIAMQARDKEHYEQEKAKLPPEALDFKLADPKYLEAVEKDTFLDNHFGEWSATKYLATVVKNASWEELKKAASFQMWMSRAHRNGPRHLQQVGISENEWMERGRRLTLPIAFSII